MKTEKPESYCLFGRARVDRNWASCGVGMFPITFASVHYWANYSKNVYRHIAVTGLEAA
jgi:hypothetical protein